MKPTSKVAMLAASLITLGFLTGGAYAALILTVDEFTSTHITITVTGTLDADTTGLLNAGAFFVAPSNDLTTQWYAGGLTEVIDTMEIGGAGVEGGYGVNNGSYTGYSLYWAQSDPSGFQSAPDGSISAGTVVSGTIRMTGAIDNVNFSASDFKLYSGLLSPRVANRFEASAVPEPSSAMILGLGAFGLATRRRRTT